MSSKRDLVEAHAFNRRRLITAFVSGSPGGREVEPVRYGRTLVGGLVLAILLVAGAAVSGLIKPAVPKDWLESGLVIGKTSGSRFVASNGTLFPVINTTSARLLSPDGELKVDFVPDDKIKKAKQGATIGIQGAPDVLPNRSRLLSNGWTACTNQSRGIALNLSTRPSVSQAPDAAFRVTSDGRDYVIAGNRRYAVPSGDRADALLRPFRLDQAPAREVSGLWLDLVPPGSEWKTFEVDGQGTSVDTGVQGLDKVGRPVLVDGQPELLAEGGRLVPLSEFAYTLYRSSGPGSRFGAELKVSASDVRALKTSESRPYPSDWPTDNVQPYTSLDTPCLQLTHAESSGAPVVSLVTPSPRTFAASGSETVRRVDIGRGALVESASGGVVGSGRTFLVDVSGTRYALGTGNVARATQKALGYGDEKPAAAPPSWLTLFRDGPALSARAAAQPASQ